MLMTKTPIYFDNAATTGKKPETVIQAVCDCLRQLNANPGRSGHSLSVKASEIIYRTREAIGELFHFPNTENIVLTKNATEAINIALYGIVRQGDEVITTSMEHNSVMRPLSHLESIGVIHLKVIKADSNGVVAPRELQEAITKKTKLVVVTSASNVTGTKMPIEEIFGVCRAAGVKVLIDGAQGAGAMDIDLEKTPFDFLSITGHKHLYGPQGTGALIVKDVGELNSFMRGGTGSFSEKTVHPDFPPDKFEAGTLNMPGYAGLTAGIQFVMNEGLEKMIVYEHDLTQYLLANLLSMDEVEVYAPNADRVATVSFNVRNSSASDVAHYLDTEWGIYVRSGLQCAPMAHRTINTFPKGTVRFSLSYFNTKEEVDTVMEALKEFVRQKR